MASWGFFEYMRRPHDKVLRAMEVGGVLERDGMVEVVSSLERASDARSMPILLQQASAGK
jgi:hypothetical protein